MAVQFEDNSGMVMSRLERAKEKALMTMGINGVKLIMDEILHGYERPIYKNGDLFGSIEHDMPSNDEIHVGTNIEYAGYVHDGTYKMVARPFIKSALSAGGNALLEQAQDIIRSEMR